MTTPQASSDIAAKGASRAIRTHIASLTTAYSANEPMPMKRRACSPSSVTRGSPPMMAVIRAGPEHRWKRPAPQLRQPPHGPFIAMITWSPGRTPVTPGPVLSTTPALSWPRMYGRRVTTGLLPSIAFRSEPHTPDALIRTRTSPGPGSAISTSRISIGSWKAVRTAARISMAPTLARPAYYEQAIAR